MKSCPFCGGEAKISIVTIHPCVPDKHSIVCKCCGANVRSEDKMVAIESWNARVSENKPDIKQDE